MQETLERLRERRESGGEGGFTLIELLIVIVILGILAAIVVFAVQNLTGQSATAGCQSDYKTVETAAEAFKAQMGAYPANVAAMNTTQTQPGTGQQVGPWLRDIPSSSHYTLVIDGSNIPVGTWVSVNGGAAAQTAAAGTVDGAIYIQPTGANAAANPASTGNSAATACANVK